MFDPASLDSRRLSVSIREPFFVFEFERFVDPSVFEKLDAEFPGKSLLPKVWSERGGKYYLPSAAPEFARLLKESPIWSELYERFSDPAVVERFYRLTQAVPSERPARETYPWRLIRQAGLGGVRKAPLVERLKARLLHSTPVRVTFEFSLLEGGCYIPPHTDAVGKLISLMIYFPDKGVEYPDAAGTEFYRGRNGLPAQRGWKAGMMDEAAAREFFDAHETFYTSPFSPNKLVGFVKSSNSWHGVRPLLLPAGSMRRSLNVNYYVA